MSNQEPQNQDKTTEEAGVEKRRRFIKGASLAAPVVLTLSSPSVFGVAKECYSQQISGNASGFPAGCKTGPLPLTWLSTPNWPNFTKGTTPGGSCNYTDSTPFNVAYPNDEVSIGMANILCAYDKQNPSVEEKTLAYFVAAILNAQTAGFVLLPDQAKGLRLYYTSNGTAVGSCPPPPGYATVLDFLIAICDGT